MKLPQLLHSTRSYGRANSAFSWKLLVLERGFLSYRLKSPCDRSEKDAWFGYSPVGALRKSPLHLVFTTRRGLAPSVRVFIDFLADHFVFRDLDQMPVQLLT